MNMDVRFRRRRRHPQHSHNAEDDESERNLKDSVPLQPSGRLHLQV
jgi:hypothetical protein